MYNNTNTEYFIINSYFMSLTLHNFTNLLPRFKGTDKANIRFDEVLKVWMSQDLNHIWYFEK